MTHLSPARRCSPSLRSAAQSRVVQTYRPDPVRLGRVALRRNRWRTTMQLGNGTTRAYAYDANSRLTTQIELNGATRLVTIVDSYDPVGNRIGRNLDGVLTTWTYDDLYRLTHQDKPGQVCTYVLDPVGNLEVMWEGGANPKSFTFDAADRLVTMVEGSQLTTYTYTAFGALETEVTTGVRVTNTYDGMDQLIKVHRTVLATPFISTYTFDGDGLRRTTQEGNVQPTTMIWDGSDYLFLDGPSSDQLVLTLGGEVVASGSRDLLTDPLGSLVREITAGATLSGQFDLYPYGRLVAGSPTPATPYMFVAAYGIYRDTAERFQLRGNVYLPSVGRRVILPSSSVLPYSPVVALRSVPPSSSSCGDCGNTQEEACRWARSLVNPKDLPSGDLELIEFLGKVVCCKGKAYTCAWSNHDSPALIRCIHEHEQSHADDFPCIIDGLLEGPDTGDAIRSECFAYRKSILCLDSKCDTDAYSNVCIFALCHACRNASSYCKGAGIALPGHLLDICKRRGCRL